MSDSNKKAKKLKQGMTSAKIHLNSCLALYSQLPSLKRSPKSLQFLNTPSKADACNCCSNHLNSQAKV